MPFNENTSHLYLEPNTDYYYGCSDRFHSKTTIRQRLKSDRLYAVAISISLVFHNRTKLRYLKKCEMEPYHSTFISY